MGILGIGVDVVFVPRITSLISRRGAPRLASRILSVSELSDWNASPPANQNRFLAVRWAAKEAAYKALYPTVKPTWKQLTYRSLRASAKPTLEYHPIVEDDQNNVGKLHVSVSHDGAYIFASVVVENSH